MEQLMIYEAHQSHFHFKEVQLYQSAIIRDLIIWEFLRPMVFCFFFMSPSFSTPQNSSVIILLRGRPEEHGISFFILITRQGKLMRSQLTGSIQTKLLTIFLAGVLIKEHSSLAKRRPRQWDDIHDELGYSSKQEP